METLLILFVFLLQIVQRYDILLIQEVRDISQTSIDVLVDAVNSNIGLVLDLSCSTNTRMWAMPNLMAALPNIGGALCSTP